MSFRNYERVKSLCVVRPSASELDKRLDELQKTFDFIDLQFSTHFNPTMNEERFCALLLVQYKGDGNEK